MNFDSYPPLFRSVKNTQKSDSTNDQFTNNNSSGDSDLLPIIDMQCLDVMKLDSICKEWGIFRLVNHGVPIDLLQALQEHAKQIFNLSYEFKQVLVSLKTGYPFLGRNGSNMGEQDKELVGENNFLPHLSFVFCGVFDPFLGLRRVTRLKQEFVFKQSFVSGCPLNYFWGTPALTKDGAALQEVSSRNVDWMEGFNVAFSQLLNHHSLIEDHPLINSFRNLLKDYSEHLTKIGSTIFKAMIRCLKLDDQTTRGYLDESTGLIRVYRYPRHDTFDEVKGLHVHTDSSVLSILSEDRVGGLKFLKDDKWFNVQPVFGTLIVNLGDMMQVISDNKYTSVKHKVELNKQSDRLSICYFVFPHDNTLIHSSNYKPFTYNDFRSQVQLDLQTVGRKIALQSFKLE